jgi:N-acetylneuraminate synthase
MNKKQLLIIAEIAQAHDGSLGVLHSYIDALAEAGVDVVKFQTHIAEAESSVHEPFRVNFSYEDATRYDYWERMGFSEAQWVEIKAHCDDAGVEFMSSCFSQAAVDMMERLDMARYKIGSGEVTNFLMLEKVARTGKPIILSSGMSNLEELDAAVNFIRAFGNDLTVLQCTTAYPTPPDRVGLNVMNILRERYPNVKVGLSEHTALVATGIAAAALGAEVLEFHAVFDRRMFGPDAKSSLTIDEVKMLVDGVRQVETMLAHPIDKTDNSQYTSLKSIFEKSLAVSRGLPTGHVLTFEDLEAKKPAGHGIAASNFLEVLGKKTARTLKRYEFLRMEDLGA